MSLDLKLFIEGKDMSNEIGIINAVHDSYAGDFTDSVVATLQDKDGTWSKWRPRVGERLEVQLGQAKTGLMYIHKLTAKNGVYEVTARALPPLKNSLRNDEWESITFLQAAKTIADRLGLSLESHGVEDRTYKRLFQDGETDTAFLRRLCHQEAAEMLIYDGKLVVYDVASMERQQPLRKIDFTGKGDFSFIQNEAQRVGEVQVIRSKLTGSELDQTYENLIDQSYSSGEGIKLTYSDLMPNDDGEALRWAQNLLFSANSYLKTGRFKLSLQLDLAAGSVIEVKNDRASAWNGTVFLYRVKHDFKAQVTTLYFRGLHE